ncbi:MAG: zinc metallopeptidase [Anaerolineales bacterium]
MYTNYYIYMIPAFILMFIAQWYVSSAYKKWSRIPNQKRISGSDAARQLINSAGIYDVRVEQVQGRLTDHYDPRKKILRLSPQVAQEPSVSSLAIAAHELGHAQQDQEGYFPLRLRSAMVPLVNIGSYLGWILIFLGILINLLDLSYLGLIIFSGGAIFALLTLPVEINASNRAKQMLSTSGLIYTEEEQRGVNRVLNAAALTYVAGLVTAIMQLLYFASMITGRRR